MAKTPGIHVDIRHKRIAYLASPTKLHMIIMVASMAVSSTAASSSAGK